MKFCPVVPEICHGQVHVPKKERRRKRRIIIIIIIIIIRNGAKTISLGDLTTIQPHQPLLLSEIFKIVEEFYFEDSKRHMINKLIGDNSS
jgi:hypothetical protein